MPVVPVFPFSAVLSLAVFAIQRSLHPLYGSVPTKKNILSVVAASSAVSMFVPAVSLENALWLASLVMAVAPAATYYAGVYTTSWKDAEKGAPASLAVTFLPLFYASICIVKHLSVC
jgi:hypothetical protein